MTTARERRPFERSDWLYAGLIAAALFALYAASSPRSVAFEDDGLFILASYFLGVAHSPGYPLLVLIGKLFTYLPVGSIAYRVHLVSAFFGGLSCALLWLCARTLFEDRVAACLAAVGFGLSTVFWSQAIIAEVYTLNTFLFLLLVLLALREAPLPWLGFIFGLSLSNHWPLMGLEAPALLILLWPRRAELLRRLPALALLVVLGLAPYAWMVVRSWHWLPIAYDGPLRSIREVWYVISRSEYHHTDKSLTAGWFDRLRFVDFVGQELLAQFAVAGTLLAGIGCAMQRRLLGGRVALFLVTAFVMPTIVLVLLLRFDYDSYMEHVFQVYPLPAYAAAALWMGLGFAWVVRRYRIRITYSASGAAALLALIMAVGSRTNWLPHYDWEVRYAKTILDTLPRNAVLFVHGDVDLAPIAYLYLIEGWRPDIEIYHSAGRVLGNRLFDPLETTPARAKEVLRRFIDSRKEPIFFTMESYGGYASRDHWLYTEVDKSSRDPKKVTIDIPQEAERFFDTSIARPHEENAWVAYYQNELRRRYALLLAEQLPHAAPLDQRTRKNLRMLLDDPFGALGIAEGLMSASHGYSPAEVADALERAGRLMPSHATKAHRSRYFYLRGAFRYDQGDKSGALADFQTSMQLWPSPDNPARGPLNDLLAHLRNPAQPPPASGSKPPLP